MKKLFFLPFLIQHAFCMQELDWSKYGYYGQVPTEMQKLYNLVKNRTQFKKVQLPQLVAITGGSRVGKKTLVNAFANAVNAQWGLESEWKETPTGECDRQLRLVYFSGNCVDDKGKCRIQAAKNFAKINGMYQEKTERHKVMIKNDDKSMLTRVLNLVSGPIEATYAEQTYYRIPYDVIIFHLISKATHPCLHMQYDSQIPVELSSAQKWYLLLQLILKKQSNSYLQVADLNEAEKAIMFTLLKKCDYYKLEQLSNQLFNDALYMDKRIITFEDIENKLVICKKGQ